MGNILNRKTEARILMQGLDCAGKTTILYKLKLGEVVTSIPTIGFNVETITYKNIALTCWDVGTREKMRPLYRHYYPNTEVIVFVVDSTDRERLNEAKEWLHNCMGEDELRETPVLVFANKQDLPDAVSVLEVHEMLEIHKIRQTSTVLACSATSGEGLYEGLDWLTNAIIHKRKGTPMPCGENKGVDGTNSADGEAYVRKAWEYVKMLFTR